MATFFLQRTFQKNLQFITNNAKNFAPALNCIRRSQQEFPIRKFNTTTQLYSKLYFTDTHEWLRVENGIGTIGITDYAQEQLGDIAYCGLPDTGAKFEKGECFATIESVKAASDLYMPIAAEIMEVNNDLTDTPSIINESPFDKGWLVKIEITDAAKSDLGKLLDQKQYDELKSSED